MRGPTRLPFRGKLTRLREASRLGGLPSAPEKRTCRTGDMGMQHAALLFLRSKTGGPGEAVGALPCVVRRSLGYDSKDLSAINYLRLLLSRMSRTVKLSHHDHYASTLSKFRHSVRIRAPRIARLPDMRWAQVNCAILWREDVG
jgi:hypothetical protein